MCAWDNYVTWLLSYRRLPPYGVRTNYKLLTMCDLSDYMVASFLFNV